MAKIYREVKVSDRLPSKDGNYIVGYEYGAFSCAYSKEYSFYEEFTDCSVIEYWLEEVELPSDEGIYNAPNWDSKLTSFRNGANFILSKIKGNGS